MYKRQRLLLEGGAVAEVAGAVRVATGVPGIGRVVWDLKPAADVLTQYGGEGRLFVPAGEYTVTLTHGEAKEKQTVTVAIDPGIETR